MVNNSRIVKNSLILYVRLVIVSIIGLLSSRFILQALGTSDFGLYSVVAGIVFMMAFLNNVMIATTYRYIAFELGIGRSRDINKIFNISLAIHILLAFLVVIIAETLGVYYIKHYLNIEPDKLGDALFIFHTSIVATFFSILSVPYQGMITAKENFVVSAAIEILRSFLALGVVLIVLFDDGNRLRLYGALIAIISIIPSILYFLYSHYHFFSLTKWSFQKDIKKYKEMVGYSGWVMIGAAASAGEIQGSVLLINLFFGTILNASFGIANQVNTVVKMFSQSLNQATIPQITKSYSGGGSDRTMQLVIYSSKYSFLLMLLPSLPILLKTDFILKIWLTDVPEYTSIFIKIMIINALIGTMTAGIPAAIHATGKIKVFQLIVSSLTLTGLPCAYILFKLGYPPYSLLIVYTIISIINIFLRIYLLKRLIHFNINDFFRQAYLKMIMVSVAVSPLFLLRNIFESNILGFIGITLISVIYLLAAIYLLGINRKERELVKAYLSKFIFRIFHKAL